MIIIHILISIVFYLVLLWLSVNLIGLLVRGFFTNPELDKIEAEPKHDFIKEEVEKSKRSDKWLNLIAFLLIIGYLYATFHFWNIGVTAIAGALMLTRLPDLIWEIKNGKKITLKNMPKNALDYITTLIDWLALPALYYFLYYF